MNCFNCGEEIREPAGYICQPCLDEINANKVDEEKTELSPREAIIEMLNGKTLFTSRGDSVTWSDQECGFVFIEPKSYLGCFNNLSRKKVE